MSQMRKMLCVIATVLILCMGACALAEATISTSVVMRVSKMTQKAVVNAGEDLAMEVNIDGVEPSSYQWYFDGKLIDNANHKAYSIVNAQVEDSGIYRMDAFDADGRMLVSMDINARVIDKSIPRSGDSSMPIGIAACAFVLAMGTLLVVIKRRQHA